MGSNVVLLRDLDLLPPQVGLIRCEFSLHPRSMDKGDRSSETWARDDEEFNELTREAASKPAYYTEIGSIQSMSLTILRVHAIYLDTITAFQPRTLEPARVIHDQFPAGVLYRSCALLEQDPSFTGRSHAARALVVANTPIVPDSRMISSASDWVRRNKIATKWPLTCLVTSHSIAFSSAVVEDIYPGYTVWILPTLDLTVILREESDHYIFVATCYLYGADENHKCFRYNRVTTPGPTHMEFIESW